MTTTLIGCAVGNHIGILTLNYADKNNILSPDMIDTFLDCFQDLEKNPDIKIIIINGAGKHFCAGADLAHMYLMANASGKDNLADAKRFAQFFYRIYACLKPIITCVQGKTLGGGIGIIAASDIVIAEKNASFRFPELVLGLVPAVISPFVLQKIGLHHAQYFMLTADSFDATQALNMGLVDHIEENEPMNKALAIANEILKNHNEAVPVLKTWLHALRPVTKKEINKAAILLAKMRRTQTAKTRMREFLQ